MAGRSSKRMSTKEVSCELLPSDTGLGAEPRAKLVLFEIQLQALQLRAAGEAVGQASGACSASGGRSRLCAATACSSTAVGPETEILHGQSDDTRLRANVAGHLRGKPRPANASCSMLLMMMTMMVILVMMLKKINEIRVGDIG